MKRKEKIKKINFLYLSYLLFLIFFIYFIFFFRFPHLRVSPPEKLSLVNSYFLNKPLFLIFFNASKMLHENNEIIEIRIKPFFFQRKIEIFLKIAKPIAVIYDVKQKKYYQLDNFGRITRNLPSSENLISIISYKEIKNETILNPKLKNLFSLLFEFSNFYSFPLSKIIIHSNFDVSVFDKNNVQFLFDPNKDIEEQIKKLYLFLEYQKSHKIKNLTRVDLRIFKKIYFK